MGRYDYGLRGTWETLGAREKPRVEAEPEGLDEESERRQGERRKTDRNEGGRRYPDDL